MDINNNRSLKGYQEELSNVPHAIEQLASNIQRQQNELYKEISKVFRDCSSVYFFGMASSQWACWPIVYELLRYDKKVYWMSAYDGIELTTNGLPIKSLIFIVSQSGETIEVKKLLQNIKAISRDSTIVAVTNNTVSSLGQQADIVLNICAGNELHAPTKSYVNTIIHLLSLNVYLVNSLENLKVFLNLVSQISEKIAIYYKECTQWADEITGVWTKKRAPLQFLALGPQIASAKQASMLCSETAKIFSSVEDWATFRHGFEPQVDTGFLSLGFKPLMEEQGVWVTTTTSILKRGGQAFLIPLFPGSFEKDISKLPIHIDSIATIWSTLPIHHLCIALAREKGLDASKIERKVTLEL